MALTFTPSAQDLVSVLGELEERTHPILGPWCRPADAQAVRRAIIDRTDDLRKLLNQAVRLIRVAALASARDYTQFLYLDVPALRPRFFKAALERAAGLGRLSGRIIAIDEAGVRLREPAMALSTELALALRDYELSYAQMPRSAILLDVLHNTLGYRLVAELAQGITTHSPAASAAQVAQNLRSRFNAWLAPRLESAHRRQQAKVLHAFLASQDALSPHAINDEVVFAFWRSRAQAWHEASQEAGKQTSPARALASVEKAARDEGFRVFRTAVKSLLRYRQALADAADADALNLETSIPPEAAPPAEGHLRTASPWQSPLVSLARPPADRVKWLTETEYRWLTNYLGRRPVSPGDGDGSGDQDLEAPEGPSGLMEGRPFDLALLRTLLRVDTFAPIQASLIAGLKKRRGIADLLVQALTCAERMTYHDAVKAYAALKDKVEMEALAALNALAEGGEPMALLLIQHFAPEARAALDLAADALPPQRLAVLRANRPGQRSMGEEDREEADDLREGPERLARFGRVIRNAFCGEPRCGILGALITRSAAARKKIARTGFKPHEVERLEGRRALAEAVPSIIAVADQLARLIERLKALNPESAGATDGRKFADVLRLIYRTPEEPTPE